MHTLDATDQQIIDMLRRHEPDLIALCQRLLQTPSVNGVHPEAGVVDVLHAAAQDLGLHAQISAKEPTRPNVIVSTHADGETGLLLVGHTDTVPSGDESAWTHPPFGGVLANGRIYGRGAVDTKGGMAAALWALAALARVPNALPHGRAQFVGVPDEETGATGTLGIKHLDAQDLLHGRGAIYAYSGRTIYIGHRGVIRYRVVCHGQATHTGGDHWQQGTRGANAVTGMAALLLRLEAHPFPHSTRPYFSDFRTLITPGTVIQGGVNINIVPDTCEALIDIRTTPEYDLPEVEPILQAHINAVTAERPALRFSFERLNHMAAALSDPAAPIFSALQAVTQAVTGHMPPLEVAGPANEGYLLIGAGIPTVCGFGPIGDNFHSIDEYVEANSLVEAAILYALTARRLAQS